MVLIAPFCRGKLRPREVKYPAQGQTAKVVRLELQPKLLVSVYATPIFVFGFEWGTFGFW